MKYQAFISYSHLDDKWGKWFHRRLEAYRIPKAIVGSQGRDGPIPDRLGKIFRDREELPSSADLGTMLIDAMDNARYLVVLCTPDSAKSRWVNEEILHFKRTDRENRILAVIIDGEPNATDIGQPDNECFPPALRFAINQQGGLTDERIEPIAADVRPTGDGRTNAFIKIVAGLLGTDFDALRQRELRRKKRRFAQAAIASACIALLISGLSIAAYFQSNRANSAIAQNVQLQEVAQNLKSKWMGEGAVLTPLIDAVLLSDTAQLSELSPSSDQLNEPWGPDQLTPLMIACMIGDPDTVNWLLNHGAQTDLFNPHGDAAIHMIADTGQIGALEPLQRAGADLDLGSKARGAKGWRLIDAAAGNGSVEVIAELLRLGVPIEIEPKGTAYPSPLFVAAWFGQSEAAQLLIDHGARTNIKYMEDQTPYKTALGGGYPQTAALIGADSGVSTETVTNEALYNAVTLIILGQMDLSEATSLIQQGADVNFVGEHGSSTFALAVNLCMTSNDPSLKNQRPIALSLVQILLDAGGDVNSQSIYGVSLKQSIEMMGDTELIELLYNP